MGLNNYHRAKKAYGYLKPENILVFSMKPHGPLVTKLDKMMARKGNATISDDLRDLGMIYRWLYMIGRQYQSQRVLISPGTLTFSEDIFTDRFVDDIIEGLMSEDPKSIDEILQAKEMRAAYVAFMR